MESILTAVVKTNQPDQCRTLLSQILPLGIPVVLVVDNAHNFSGLAAQSDQIQVIQTKSQNFSYLSNLGIFYARSQYIFRVDSDEVLSLDLIESLKHLRFGPEAYSVLVKTLFAGQVIHAWSLLQPRIIRKDVAHFIGRVHERNSSRLRKVKGVPGYLTNDSFRDWKHYYEKRSRYLSLETRDPVTVVERAAAPILHFLTNRGVRDGEVGIKLLYESLQYARLVASRGIRSVTQDPAQAFLDLHKGLDTIALDSSEYVYLSKMRQSLEQRNIPFGSNISEELEQLTSAFNSTLANTHGLAPNGR
jgi:hypothetical protein